MTVTPSFGRVPGPRGYLPPEARADPESAQPGPVDVYCLAQTLWVLATESQQPLGVAIEGRWALSRMLPAEELAPALDDLLARATASDPDERPDMDEFAATLSSIIAGRAAVRSAAPAAPTDGGVLLGVSRAGGSSGDASEWKIFAVVSNDGTRTAHGVEVMALLDNRVVARNKTPALGPGERREKLPLDISRRRLVNHQPETFDGELSLRAECGAAVATWAARGRTGT